MKLTLEDLRTIKLLVRTKAQDVMDSKAFQRLAMKTIAGAINLLIADVKVLYFWR